MRYSTPGSVPRRAYTLMELLVVIIIMMTLVAIALPMAKKTMEDSTIRDASRQLNAYMAMAKVRAVQTGRPCGLDFVCTAPLGDSSGIRQVQQMYLAEVPPPYSGGTPAARGRILQVGSDYEFVPVSLQTTLAGSAYLTDATELAYLYSLIDDGEQFWVRFDLKGAWFKCWRQGTAFKYQIGINPPTIQGMTNNGTSYPFPPAINIPSGAMTPPGHPGFTYQILRSPRRVGNPLELPSETCIDLAFSGIGTGIQGAGTDFFQGTVSGNFNNLNLNRLVLLFSPTGGIEGYYAQAGTTISSYSPSGNVYFLVGKVNKMNPPLLANANPNPPSGVNFILNMFDPAMSNLADPLALWVSVGRNTGVVTTAENSPPVVLSNDPGQLTLQNLDVTGNTIDAAGNALPPIKIDPTQPGYLVNATNGIYGRAKYIEMCRQLAATQQQMRGR